MDVFLSNTATITFSNPSTTQAPSFTPLMTRTDQLSLNGSDVFDAFGNALMPHTSLGKNPLPTDTRTYTNIAVYNNYNIVDYTIDQADPSLTDYEGGGNLSFSYTPIAFINNVLSPATYTTPVITDNLTFTITYSYCAVVVLSSNITAFTATRENDKLVALNWATANEQPGRRYAIEVSTDGKNFKDYGWVTSDSVNSDASYSYDYTIVAGAAGKLYFRLKQVQDNGTTSYSSIRVIDLGTGGPSGFSLYPNPPSDYINLSFPVTHAWQVDILAADGSVIQRNYYPDTNLARVNFNRKLPAGTYFARATDAQGGKGYVGSFTIQ